MPAFFKCTLGNTYTYVVRIWHGNWSGTYFRTSREWYRKLAVILTYIWLYDFNDPSWGQPARSLAWTPQTLSARNVLDGPSKGVGLWGAPTTIVARGPRVDPVRPCSSGSFLKSIAAGECCIFVPVDCHVTAVIVWHVAYTLYPVGPKGLVKRIPFTGISV